MLPNRLSIFGNLPPVVKNLLIINVLVFLADMVLPQLGIDLSKYLALYNIQSPNFKPYQFVTYMFMHGGITHIFFNMFALIMFGRVLESVWGQKRFLIYYFVTGIGAAVLHNYVNYVTIQDIHEKITAFTNTPSPELLMQLVREYPQGLNLAVVNDIIASYSTQPANPVYLETANEIVDIIYKANLNIPTVGASGAVFGVLLAFGMLFPNTKLMLLFPPIPIKAKYFVIFYGAAELFAAVMQQPGDNIAHLAHLGGMIFGFLLIKYWNKKGIGNFDRF